MYYYIRLIIYARLGIRHILTICNLYSSLIVNKSVVHLKSKTKTILSYYVYVYIIYIKKETNKLIDNLVEFTLISTYLNFISELNHKCILYIMSI